MQFSVTQSAFRAARGAQCVPNTVPWALAARSELLIVANSRQPKACRLWPRSFAGGRKPRLAPFFGTMHRIERTITLTHRRPST